MKMNIMPEFILIWGEIQFMARLVIDSYYAEIAKFT